MTEEPRSGAPRSGDRPSRTESLVDDAFGVDFKVPRTLRDLVVRPGRVADAALAGDRTRYTPPVRLFIAIFAVQALLFGWLGADTSVTLAASLAENPVGLAAVEERLAEAGSSVAEADRILSNWYGWLNWPITMVSSFLYVLVIWAMRPSLGFFKSLMLYLVPTNASYVVALPLLVAAWLFGLGAFVIAALVAFATYFLFAGLVLHRRAAATVLGLATRLVVLLVASVPIFMVIYALLVISLEVALVRGTGVSWFQLIAIAGSASSAS